MAQLGSASALGAEGRRFKSGYPDQMIVPFVWPVVRGWRLPWSGITGYGA
jgi:hypothetical protein